MSASRELNWQIPHHYEFLIHRIQAGVAHYFQLRIGMVGEEPVEFIPAHQSAFARRFDFAPVHSTEVDAHMELSGLLEWIGGRATC